MSDMPWVIINAKEQAVQCLGCGDWIPTNKLIGKTTEEATDILSDFIDQHRQCGEKYMASLTRHPMPPPQPQKDDFMEVDLHDHIEELTPEIKKDAPKPQETHGNKYRRKLNFRGK